MSITDAETWFINVFQPKANGLYEIKHINERDGDLGDVVGVQFDSESKGGYAYFWSNGYVSYQLSDYINDRDIVDDNTEKLLSSSLDEAFASLLLNL